MKKLYEISYIRDANGWRKSFAFSHNPIKLQKVVILTGSNCWKINNSKAEGNHFASTSQGIYPRYWISEVPFII